MLTLSSIGFAALNIICTMILSSECPDCDTLCSGTVRARSLAQTLLNVPYGEGDGEKLDVYIPNTSSLGKNVAVFTLSHFSDLLNYAYSARFLLLQMSILSFTYMEAIGSSSGTALCFTYGFKLHLQVFHLDALCL